ncbi:MAG TPA: PHP domain-containing protein [Clostridiales bacterium]|nr:PHP domain-containing protein [Clostridiales bacterium]
MKYADLHIHTTASDGILSPEEIVKWAKKIFLSAIAITDHDTVNGIESAIKEGTQTGIEVIPGIELGARMGNYEIHILGYYIDYKQSSLQTQLDILQMERTARAKKMIDNLNKLYDIDLDVEYVKKIAKDATISRPHIGRALIEKGIVQNLAEAFDRYIGNGCPAYIPRKTLSPQECIRLIKEYKGIPVLAHPGLIENMNIVKEIIKMDIEGIEIYHPKHTTEQEKLFEELCRQNHLLATGGSDFHDEFIDDVPSMGNIRLPYTYVELLKNKKFNRL